MEIVVERAVIGQTKSGRPKTGLFAAGKWHNIFEHHPEYQGKKVRIEPSKYQGFYDAELVGDHSVAQSTGNGLDDDDPRLIVNWTTYETYMKIAHALASELEPDGYAYDDEGKETSNIVQDRSRARAALVNTAMIAVFGKDSKIVIEDLKVPF